MNTIAKPALLIVDDDPLITDTLHFVLSNEFEVFVAESRQQVKSLLTQLREAPPLALVDLGLPPAQHKPDEGFALIADLLNYSKKIRILVLSGQNDEANARHARALGAIDFIAKPAEPEQIKQALLSALRFDQEAAEAPKPEATPESSGIIGASFAIDRLRNQIKLYADAPFPVLIEGESGSGKELVAKSLHQWSKRSSKPYLA
ncbi:MAG TPA: response regulator, partial [Thiobacillaceae bacterium]|nr:response regulator [Thiobacillaceae bacterium]HNI08193.1 response regulator [Thiobacillaceae bacterium]